jgi:hypothetical protein
VPRVPARKQLQVWLLGEDAGSQRIAAEKRASAPVRRQANMRDDERRLNVS